MNLNYRLRSLYSNEYTFFVLVAVLIGLFAGLANFVFVEAYGFIFDKVVLPFRGSPYVIIPVIGGGLILCLLSFVFRDDVLGYGFPKFLEKVNLRGGVLKLRETVAKTVGSCITLGFGGSAGQEGPIAQLGGAIGGLIGQFFKVSRSKIRVFVACGVAAGIAATFNAPVAGVLFAEEIALLRDFKVGSFLPIVISSAVGTVVSQALRGNEPVFKVPTYQFISTAEFFFYALFGIVLGVFASGFIKLFFLVKDLFFRITNYSRIKPILGGLIVGTMGIFSPYVLGNGYEFVEKALVGSLPLVLTLGLIVLKPIATTITLGTGWPGGVFAPSIFIGAVAGNAFGRAVEYILSSPVNLSSSYATVGMGTFLAAVTQAPLTSIFLIFEMTQSYQVVIPIMISSVIGIAASKLLVGGSLESLELKKAGIDIEEQTERRVLHSIRVNDIMTTIVETIFEGMTLRNLMEYVPGSHFTTFPVVDREGNLTGIISIQDFREFIFEESIKDFVVVKELATLSVLTATPDDTLYTVLKKLERKSVEILPVIESNNSRKIVGVLSRKNVIGAYNKALSEGTSY